MAQYHQDFGIAVEKAMRADNEELIQMIVDAGAECDRLYNAAWVRCAREVPPEVALSEQLVRILENMCTFRGLFN